MISKENLDYLALQLENLKSKTGKQCSSLPTAIYVRKSREDEKDTSLPGQIIKCKELITSCSYLELVSINDGIFQDDGKSGMFTYHRTGYNQLHKLVEEGLVKVVVVYANDRLARRWTTFVEFRDYIESKGGAVVSVTESFNRDASGRLSERITGAVAQYQCENTAEHTMRTNLTVNAPKCISSGGVCNYGYKFTASRNMVINEEEAPAVRLIFQRFAEFKSYKEIADELEQKGFLTRAGHRFSQLSILTIVRNVKYTGTYTYNIKGGRKKAERVLIPTYDEVRIPNGIPRLVSDEVFAICQTRLKSRQVSGGKTPVSNSNYLLTGLMFCADCGASWHGMSKTAGHQHKKYYQYVCSTYDNPGNGKHCSQKPIHQEVVEKVVAKVVSDVANQIFTKTDVLKMFEYRLSSSLKNTIENCKRSSGLLEAKKNKILSTITNVTDTSLISDLQKQYSRCNDLLTETSKNKAKAEQELKLVSQKVKAFKNKFSGFTLQSLLQNRQLLATLIKKFIKTIKIGDSIEIELNDMN